MGNATVEALVKIIRSIQDNVCLIDFRIDFVDHAVSEAFVNQERLTRFIFLKTQSFVPIFPRVIGPQHQMRFHPRNHRFLLPVQIKSCFAEEPAVQM